MPPINKEKTLKQKMKEDQLIIASSRSPRALQTTAEVAEILWYSKGQIISTDDLSYLIRDSNTPIPLSVFGTDFLGNRKWEWDGWEDFLELVSQTSEVREVLIAPYLKMLQNFFSNVERTGKTQIIYSFRHGEKDKTVKTNHEIQQPLTDKGKEQAKSLGERLKDDINLGKTKKQSLIRVLGGHQGIDECILAFLFWGEKMPESWLKGRDFAEEVKYVFEKKDWETLLTVAHAWEVRTISKKEFDQLMQRS